LSLSRKEPHAHKLQLPYRSRSALAREIVDFVVAQLPERRLRLVKSPGSCKQVRQQTRHFCGIEVRWLELVYSLQGRPAVAAYASCESVVVQTH